MNPIGIVNHHSLTNDGLIVDTNAIWNYHISYRIDGNIVSLEEFERRANAKLGKIFERPWKSVGYHYLLENINGFCRVIKGRMDNMEGSHAKGFNQDFLGICWVGNFNEKPPPEDMWNLGLQLNRALMDIYGIKTINVLGHRETYYRLGKPVEKSCPGWKFDMEKFRKDL